MKVLPFIFYLFTCFCSLAQADKKLYKLTLENIENKKYKKALSNIDKALLKNKQEKYILIKVDILYYFKNSYKRNYHIFKSKHY